MSASVEIKKTLDRLAGVPLVGALRLARSRRVRPARLEEPPRRILGIKLWGIGNLSMVLPLLGAIRRTHPRARVDLLTLERNREFVECCPFVDRSYYFSHEGSVSALLCLKKILARVREQRYDLLIDFEQFLKVTALFSHFAGARLSVGFRTRGQARHGLYDIAVPHDDRRHMSLVFGDLLRAVGIEPKDPPELFAPPPRTDTPLLRRLSRATAGSPRVVLHPGSGDNFEGRRWPPESFARAADLIHARTGARIVLTGAPHEVDVVRSCAGLMDAPAVDLCGLLTLRDLVDVLASADIVISNDTAPVHLASALGVPLIALYGPNTPRLYGPLSGAARVFHRELACSPCLTNTNAKTSFCRRPLCLQSIDAADVAEAALEMLRKRAPVEVATT